MGVEVEKGTTDGEGLEPNSVSATTTEYDISQFPPTIPLHLTTHTYEETLIELEKNVP